MTRKEMEKVLVEKYQLIHRWAFSYTGNRFDADDIAQDVALKAIENCEKFVDGEVGKWLYTIVKNTYYKRITHDTFLDTTDDMSTVDECVQVDVMDNVERIMGVRVALGKIREDYRKAIEMFAEGYKYKEIAETMGTTIGNVCTLVNRGRAAIEQYCA